MGKIWLIITREYYTRVRKPSFLVITILGPILMAALFITPVYLSMREQKKYNIAVVDSSSYTDSFRLHGANIIKYEYYKDNALAKKDLISGAKDLVLFIPSDIMKARATIRFYFKNQPGFIAVEKIKSDVINMREEIVYHENGIDKSKLQFDETIRVLNKMVGDNGEEKTTNSSVSMGIGLVGAVVMYMFIFIYGVQVMRGVMEEKTSRIVEVIISSVRPFQLMMGKIIGIAMVGLTQFLLWIVLTFVLVTVAQQTVLKDIKVNDPTDLNNNPMRIKPGDNAADYFSHKKQNNNDMDISKIVGDITGRNIFTMIGIFLFYFMGGYLLYSSLFAAVGSAVDSESDSQQFMLPVTIPIIFSLVMAESIMTNPDGPLAVWLSIIPLTSPVVMMIRMPFIEPGWQLGLSMVLLVLGFIFTTWLAGRIYRTGILMYGKKPTWREIGKWLFYKG